MAYVLMNSFDLRCEDVTQTFSNFLYTFLFVTVNNY